jgi:hypothetical protein
MSSTWDRFHFATLELVRSSPIKQRLIGAYRRHLSGLTEDQLPREIRQTFVAVMRALEGVRPMPGEDAVSASVRKMSSQEADDCATRIVEIFEYISRANAEPERPPQSPSGTVVHLYAIESLSPEQHEIPAAIAIN